MGAGLIVILILLIIAGLCLLLSFAINKLGKKRYGEEVWERVCQDVVRKEELKKYNNLQLTCPACKSNKVKTISNASRAVSMMGIASSKIGKQFECDNCGYKW